MLLSTFYHYLKSFNGQANKPTDQYANRPTFWVCRSILRSIHHAYSINMIIKITKSRGSSPEKPWPLPKTPSSLPPLLTPLPPLPLPKRKSQTANHKALRMHHWPIGLVYPNNFNISHCLSSLSHPYPCPSFFAFTLIYHVPVRIHFLSGYFETILGYFRPLYF